MQNKDGEDRGKVPDKNECHVQYVSYEKWFKHTLAFINALSACFNSNKLVNEITTVWNNKKGKQYRETPYLCLHILVVMLANIVGQHWVANNESCGKDR